MQFASLPAITSRRLNPAAALVGIMLESFIQPGGDRAVGAAASRCEGVAAEAESVLDTREGFGGRAQRRGPERQGLEKVRHISLI